MKTIRRMMDHLYWANERLLEGIQNGGATQEMTTILRHALIAEQVWLLRLQGRSSRHLVLWAEGNLAELGELARENERQYRQYVAALTDEALDQIVEYTNQSGEPFRSSVRDILTHVALHSQYHRGQLNRALRQAGAEPVNVDLILYVRSEPR